MILDQCYYFELKTTAISTKVMVNVTMMYDHAKLMYEPRRKVDIFEKVYETDYCEREMIYQNKRLC